MKKILLKSYLVLMLSTFCAIDAHATVLSRIDVSGNQRMDNESVRIYPKSKSVTMLIPKQLMMLPKDYNQVDIFHL